MPARRLIESEVAPAYPASANSSAAARISRCRWSGIRISGGGACRPRAVVTPPYCRTRRSALEGAAVVTLVVVPVRAGADRLPPRRVLPVPVDGPRQPLVEPHAGAPPER